MNLTGIGSKQDGKSNALSAVVVDPHHHDLSKIVQTLTQSRLVDVTGETTSRFLASSLVERERPDFVFITVQEQNVTTENFIKSIKALSVDIHVVMLGASPDPDLILHCFRAGADEFLTLPLKIEDFIPSIDRLRERRASRQSAPSNQGRVIGVWGARGGSGTTTLACNLAHSLLKHGPVMLVDFHFAQGDMSVYFDLQPSYSLMDLSETADRLDRTLIDSITTRHDSGLSLLLQPFDQYPPQLSNDELCHLIYELQQMYPYVVIDLGHDEEIVTLAAPYLRHLVLTVKPDLPGVFLASRKLNWLGEIGFDMQQLTVAVNGYSSRCPLSKDRIQRAINRRKAYFIREDEKRARMAIDRGVPLRSVSRWSKAGRDIDKLADQLRKADDVKPAPLASNELPALNPAGNIKLLENLG